MKIKRKPIQTRIKIIQNGNNELYIPQVKGYIPLYDDWNRRYIIRTLCTPVLGILYLLMLLMLYLISLFWFRIQDDPYTSLIDAERKIDDLLNDIVVSEKPINNIKRYIKYP